MAQPSRGSGLTADVSGNGGQATFDGLLNERSDTRKERGIALRLRRVYSLPKPKKRAETTALKQ
jgi:hypothetical protein